MRPIPFVAFPLALLVAGCGSGDEAADPPVGPIGPEPCEGLTVSDGSCVHVGVPPDDCAAGFVHDGASSCEPVLPAEACAPGSMALPGDTECAPIMPCGAGKWGDIAREPSTIHVDESFNGVSDGSEMAPWTSIAQAITAAQPAELIAVAAGRYSEDLFIDKSVRIAGVCPEKVEIVGDGSLNGPLTFLGGGGHISGVALTGMGIGALVQDSADVSFERVWVNATSSRGINIQQIGSATSVTVTRSLIEGAHDVGIYVLGATVQVQDTVIRDTQLRTDGQRGRGISIEPCAAADNCMPSVPATAVVERSIVERNHDVGVQVLGSNLRLDGSVVRDSLPTAAQTFGRGLNVQPCQAAHGCTPTLRSMVELERSLLERNHEVSVLAIGSELHVRSSVIRNTLPQVSDNSGGGGVSYQSCDTCAPVEQSFGSVTSSTIDGGYELGLLVSGSQVATELTLIANTLARASDGLLGDGLVSLSTVAAPGVADVNAVLVSQSARAGVVSFGATVNLGNSQIRCAGFDLDASAYNDIDPLVEDRGGNICGCDSDGECKISSSGLVPPAPLEGN